MDERDEAIIEILGRKSGLSSRTLAKILDMPISTVHRRIKKLEQEGIIKGYKALIEYEKTNYPISALLLINLAEVTPGRSHIPKKDVLNSLRKFDELEAITEVQAANFDLVLRARFQSLKKLSEFVEELRFIEGIEEISSAIITDENVLPPQKLLDNLPLK